MSVRGRYFLLIGLRWFAVGLIVPLSTLFMYSRGLNLTQIGIAVAAQGVMTLLLEIPSGALGDSWGRRPVQVSAAIAAVVGYSILLNSYTVPAFVLAFCLIGTFRALDSGALESWFVDVETEQGRAAQVPSGLARASGITSVSIAVGSLLCAGYLFWSPLGADELTMPFIGVIVLMALQGVLAFALMRDSHRILVARPGWKSALADGLRLVLAPTLRWFFLAMVLFGAGIIALENYTPLRLQSFGGSLSDTAASFAIVTAIAWGISGVGSLIVSRKMTSQNSARLTVALGLCEGFAILLMAFAGTPTILILGFWAAYSAHGAFGAGFNSLVHARVDNSLRGTALSVMSMAFLSSASVAGIWLGLIADNTSLSIAQGLGGLLVVAAAILVGLGANRAIAVRAENDLRPELEFRYE